MAADNIQILQPRPQLAAVPWRRVNGELEILMVTSRASRHWLIPKGWPMRGKRNSEAAAVEAFEEAGVKGRISSAPIGIYRYGKLLPDGSTVPVEVEVYALEVRKELADWPERGSRERRWVTPAIAATEAHEQDLAQFLRGLNAEAIGQDAPRKSKSRR